MHAHVIRQLFMIALIVLSSAVVWGETNDHPLRPLSAEEMKQAVTILRTEQKLAGELLFPLLALDEPTKSELASFATGKAVPRRASAVVLDRKVHRTYEALIDLASGKVLRWQELPGVHPTVLLGEYKQVADLVRSDPQWQAAMRKRGITNFDQVNLDAWAPGHLVIPGVENARLMRVLSFYRGEGVNAYGRPVEGVVAVVNLDTNKVVRLIDAGVVPVSQDGGTDFFDAANVKPRPPLKPLVISQPEGASFEVRGNEIRWDNWRLRYSLHPREGLVLHQVAYAEGDKIRSILHRASVAEMVVPYGDAAETWNWRSAFDQGEYGLGRTCNTLQLGLDVPANAALLDTVFADDLGNPYVQPATVAVYEQDGGVLWKHYDETSGKTAIRRARQLVIGTVTTIGNYDYGMNWIFHQDGTLETRIDLTGILLVKGVKPQTCEKCAAVVEGLTQEPQGDQRYGTLVGKSVVATNHQHIFSFRLDFDVDGVANSITESTVRPVPAGPENPAANAFIHVEKPLRTEKEARRNLSLQDHRRWRVYNSTQRNSLGHFPGYLLEPGANCVPKLGAESVTRKRAGYIDHHLWVTRHKEEEDHAAGDYPRQRSTSDGLPQWSGEESIENQDVVLWYTMAVTHVPRAEEWPVMSAAHSGFSLVPANFFVHNPALDVPEQK